MGRLAFCVDEHVPNAYETALNSNGFTTRSASETLGAGTDDAAVLAWCGSTEHVLVTNDRDFVRLDRAVEHAGIVLYTTQTMSPGEFVRAIRRIDRQFTRETISDVLVWLEPWV